MRRDSDPSTKLNDLLLREWNGKFEGLERASIVEKFPGLTFFVPSTRVDDDFEIKHSEN